jgi:hypothetical protein
VTYTDLPDQGWVFWPVGNGDSTTVVVDREHVIQVDLRDMKAAEDDDAVVAPIVDQLVEHLPRTADDRPRLAVFAVGHHDHDHCAGARRLFDEVLVEQLWVTPRMWHEKASGVALCEDAAAVFAEAERRIGRTVAAAARGEAPAPGDQLRVIGNHPDADSYSYAALPQDHLFGTGTEVTVGDPSSAHAEVTVHGPTAGDCSVLGETGRNSSSALLRVLLLDGDGAEAGLLLVGDADYSVLERMFADADAAGRLDQLEWDTTVAAHHCSRHAVFGPNAEGNEERKQLVLDGLEATARPGARIVVSSRPFQSRDAAGDDPPHRVAREAYEEDVVTDEVLCTAEHPDIADPRPVVFSLQPEGLVLIDPADLADMAATAAAESKNLSLSRAGPRVPLLAALGATSSVHPSGRITTYQATAEHQTGGDHKGVDAVHESVRRARGRSAGPPTSIGFG